MCSDISLTNISTTTVPIDVAAGYVNSLMNHKGLLSLSINSHGVSRAYEEVLMKEQILLMKLFLLSYITFISITLD